MDEDLESRLTDLEVRLAHAERLTEDLSSIIADQAKTIDSLTRHARQVTARLGDFNDTLAGLSQDDKPPPHY